MKTIIFGVSMLVIPFLLSNSFALSITPFNCYSSRDVSLLKVDVIPAGDGINVDNVLDQAYEMPKVRLEDYPLKWDCLGMVMESFKEKIALEFIPRFETPIADAFECIFDQKPLIDMDRQRDRDQDPVPEPATLVFLGMGLLGIAGISKKRMAR